jgi:hypothetical protein
MGLVCGFFGMVGVAKCAGVRHFTIRCMDEVG